MRENKYGYQVLIILLVVVVLFTLTACGSTEESTNQTVGETAAVSTEAQSEEVTRVDGLLAAWGDAGIDASLQKKSSSSTLNGIYGCINQYVVKLDDEQFMILEYDLGNLNGIAENYLSFIDENGYDSKTSDPVWRNESLLLMNSYSLLESGTVVDEFMVSEHEKSETIIEIFQSFEQ